MHLSYRSYEWRRQGQNLKAKDSTFKANAWTVDAESVGPEPEAEAFKAYGQSTNEHTQ